MVKTKHMVKIYHLWIWQRYFRTTLFGIVPPYRMNNEDINAGSSNQGSQ